MLLAVSAVAKQPNIAAAIARSKRGRKAFHRRRRRLVLAGCACLAAAIPLSLSFVGVTGNDVVHAAVSQAKSLAELLDHRSPGARTEAQLTKTRKVARALPKQRPVGVAAVPAPQPDLAAILAAPPVTLPAEFETPVPLTELPSPPSLAAIVTPSPGGLVVIPPGAGGGVTPPGGGGGVTPPGGGGGVSPPGGGGPITFPTDQPKVPVTPPAVPEPGTWATMLLGFALIGWRARRRGGALRRPQLI
jgi:hypothetical protein